MADDLGYDPTPKRKKKKIKKVSPEYLERYALWYLERYSSSTRNLTNKLMEKVRASAQEYGTDSREAQEWVHACIAKLQELGYLSDSAYAEMRVRSLRRQGKPRRAIEQNLRAKGVSQADLDKAMADLVDDLDGQDADLIAALKYCKKRRFGPYRSPEKRAERAEKDKAAMLRQGFRFDHVSQILAAETVEDLDNLTL